MAKINGKLFIFKADDTAGTPVILGGAKTASMDISVDMIDETDKDSADWKEQAPGTKSWTVSTGGLVVASNAALAVLRAAVGAGTAIDVELDETGTKLREAGTGYVSSFSKAGDQGDDMTYDITIEGTGVLTESTYV